MNEWMNQIAINRARNQNWTKKKMKKNRSDVNNTIWRSKVVEWRGKKIVAKSIKKKKKMFFHSCVVFEWSFFLFQFWLIINAKTIFFLHFIVQIKKNVRNLFLLNSRPIKLIDAIQVIDDDDDDRSPTNRPIKKNFFDDKKKFISKIEKEKKEWEKNE